MLIAHSLTFTCDGILESPVFRIDFIRITWVGKSVFAIFRSRCGISKANIWEKELGR